MLSDFERKLLRILYNLSDGFPEQIINVNMRRLQRMTGKSPDDIRAAMKVLIQNRYVLRSLKQPGKWMVAEGWESKRNF